MDLNSLQSLMRDRASRAIELASSLGADQSEVSLSADEGLTVSVRMGELESVERQKNRALGITVYKDHCKGNASTTDFSEAGMEAAVRKAVSIATFTAADPCSGLADAALMAQASGDLDLYHPWPIDVDEAAAIALATEEAARSFDRRIENSEGASVSADSGLRIYANSHGFCGSTAASGHSIGCSVVARENGSLERDYWSTSARSSIDLQSPQSVGRRAAERAVTRLGSRQISTRVAPVLYPAELARGFIAHFVSAISGSSQYRRASFLLDASGQQVFSPEINIDEAPHIPRAMGSRYFDEDGVATQSRRLVDGGTLTGYVLGSYSARRLGLQTTGNAGGVHNLVVAPTAGAMQEILADCPRAFVVGELLGQGVNTVTGDYSRGAAGFWYENGELVHAVSEITIAGNLNDMLKKIVAVGSDVDERGVIRTGCILVDAMTIAGQ